MKTYILVYESFANFEVVLASHFLKTEGEIITVGLSKEPVHSGEGFTILPDVTVAEVDPKEVDALIIPGGRPDVLEEADDLLALIKAAQDNDAAIAAICSGVLQLARAGILVGKKFTTTLNHEDYDAFEGATYINEPLTLADNIITAKANAYVDFALTLGEMMDIFGDDDDYEATVEFFKFFKS